MKVLVCGSTGCVGRAVVHALRSRGHRVVEGSRGAADSPHGLKIDFAQAVAPAEWAARLRGRQVDAVVNCVGILMPSRGQSFERVHTQGPIELFRGASLAGVKRVLQVSALGVGTDAAGLASPYLHSKLCADDALAGLPLDWAVVRPSLVYGPGSQSAALFATLASLPVIGLPGRGLQQVQPIHVYELAEAMVRMLESPLPLRVVHELGGARTLGYREMLAHYREALGLQPAVSLPVPMPLMRLGAWAAEALPQKVFCRDTIALLERGSVPAANAMPALLGREPSTMPHGLRITPPDPLVDLRVRLSAPVEASLRAMLAFMWVYAAVALLPPGSSGVMHLLARCGLEGGAAQAALLLCSALHLLLGGAVLLRPSAGVYLLQLAAVVGDAAVAAAYMPELALDPWGPIARSVPVLGLVVVLWLAAPRAVRAPAATATVQAR
jgi:uncharacterized protein YbjT (DUF2867 family)